MKTLETFGEKLHGLAASINEKTFKNRITYTIDCHHLPVGITGKDVFDEPAIDTIFRSVYGIRHPVIYWFSIGSLHGSLEVYKKMLAARKKILRKFPAQPPYRGDTKILYVGKVNRDLFGRMISHFGYGEDPNTQGLQLCHWAKSYGLKLNLHCMILPDELSGLIFYIEEQIAKELQPLIGRY